MLFGRSRDLKEAKTMEMKLGKCKCPNSFPYFQQHILKVHIGMTSMRQFVCSNNIMSFLFNK